MACPIAIFAQTPTLVDTTQQNRKALLEEFTGFSCGPCFDGHKYAKRLLAGFPEEFSVIAVHTGGKAIPTAAGDPDYVVPIGDTLGKFFKVNAYPTGVVNRHAFGTNIDRTGSKFLGRDVWGKAVQEIIAQPSYVNIGGEATVNYTTRELTLNIEIYYTGNSSQTLNFYNVALLQNDVVGRQNGSPYYENYKHQHMLRTYFTNTWGDTIDNTTKGSFIRKSYNMILPEHYDNVNLNVENIEFVVSVMEGKTDIVTALTIHPKVIGGTRQTAAQLMYLSELSSGCLRKDNIVIFNPGEDTITNMEFELNVLVDNATEKTKETIQWTGTPIPPKKYANLSLGYQTQQSTVFFALHELYLKKVNNVANQNRFNDTLSLIVAPVVTEIPVKFFMIIKTDDYAASENKWSIEDVNGNIVKSGNLNNLSLDTINVSLEMGCYTMKVTDKPGDGMNGATFTFKKLSGELLFKINGLSNFGKSLSFDVSTTDTSVSVNNSKHSDISKQIKIYPNPVNKILTIDLANDLEANFIEITELSGRKIYADKIPTSKTIQVNMESFPRGTYFVHLYTNKGNIIEKIIKN